MRAKKLATTPKIENLYGLYVSCKVITLCRFLIYRTCLKIQRQVKICRNDIYFLWKFTNSICDWRLLETVSFI